MIQQLYNIQIQSECPQENSTITYDLDPNIPDFDQLNSVSIVAYSIPKTFYQINTQFDVSVTYGVTTYTCTFYVGNISFNQIIQKLQYAFSSDVNYKVIEYLSNEFQNTGKIRIYRTDTNNFTLTIPSQFENFFGQIDTGTLTSNYISTQVCDLLQSQFVLIKSNVCLNAYKTYDSFDVLYSVQFDNTTNFNFLMHDNIDIVQNKMRFTHTKQLTFSLTDINGTNLVFQNCQNFYLRIALFKYQDKLPDILISNQNLLIQEMKKQVDILIQKWKIKNMFSSQQDQNSLQSSLSSVQQIQN